jgi:hypothetical protein
MRPPPVGVGARMRLPAEVGVKSNKERKAVQSCRLPLLKRNLLLPPSLVRRCSSAGSRIHASELKVAVCHGVGGAELAPQIYMLDVIAGDGSVIVVDSVDIALGAMSE